MKIADIKHAKRIGTLRAMMPIQANIRGPWMLLKDGHHSYLVACWDDETWQQIKAALLLERNDAKT
ncbi:MAG: hypothetical protein ACYTEQ_22500 [Planctomycetota bacterium]|jgi:hypothetical protein